MKSTMSSIGRFFKKNVYYLLLILCIAVIATVITLTLVNANRVQDVVTPPIDSGDNNDPDPIPPDTGEETIVFDAPVRTGTIGMDYSDTEFVFSSTLQSYRTHKGIDFIAEAGTEVYAAYEGVVETVSNDIINGTMITIKHNDELKTVYKSLDREARVQVGDRVRKGDVLGTVSDSACFEVGEGAHLHFEVLKNGQLSDPYEYLYNGEK